MSDETMTEQATARARAEATAARIDDLEERVVVLRDVGRALNARAERAEAQLAALREAWEADDIGRIDGALFDPAAAEAYTRRVRAEALREAESEVRAADDIGDGGGAISAALESVADRLRARADEIERG